MTPQQQRLMNMAGYDEYSTWLDTPGLAFHFNEFVKHALDHEEALLKLQSDALQTTATGNEKP